MKKLVLLFFLCTFSCYSQVVTKEQRNVLMTFGYLHNQQETLKHIKLRFPELSKKIDHVEYLFNRKFSVSGDNIESNVNKFYGDTFNTYVSKIDTNLRTYFKSNAMTIVEALRYIEKVKMRATGMIESPILETLVEYQQLDVDINNIPIVYHVENHSHGKKLILSVEIPGSWKELDGSSSAVLKMFRSRQGNGNEIISIQKREKFNNFSSLTKEMLLNSIPTNSQIVTSYKKLINNEQIDVIEYTEANPAIGSEEKRITTRYYIVKDSFILIIDCSIYGTQLENLNLIAEQNKPIYQTIIASINLNTNKEYSLLSIKN